MTKPRQFNIGKIVIRFVISETWISKDVGVRVSVYDTFWPNLNPDEDGIIYRAVSFVIHLWKYDIILAISKRK